jgi:hypothetical protein
MYAKSKWTPSISKSVDTTTFFILKSRTAASSPMLLNVEGCLLQIFLSSGLLIQIRLTDLY